MRYYYKDIRRPKRILITLCIICYFLSSVLSSSFSKQISSTILSFEEEVPAYLSQIGIEMQNGADASHSDNPNRSSETISSAEFPRFWHMLIIAGTSSLLLFVILWIKRFLKSYTSLKNQIQELLTRFNSYSAPSKPINGFSVQTNKTPLRLRDSIFIRNHERMLKISLKDILYIKADRNYCCLHTKEKEFLVVMPLKELGKKLPFRQFLRIHRSFIINLYHIDEIGTGHVVIANKTVPLSKSSKEELLKHLHTI